LNYGARNARVVAAVGPTVGLGTSLTTNLRTSFFYNATANGATGVWTGFLKPGSAYDPTGDLAVIQPALFDQYAAVFTRYKVNKFTVKITIIGQQGSGNLAPAWNAAAYPSTDSTALTTYQAAASQPWARTVIGTFTTVNGTPPIGVGSQKELLYFKDISHDAVIGVKGDTYDTGAGIGADPPSGQYAVMPLFVQASGNYAATFLLHIDMWQNVTFNQRKPVADA